MGHDQRLKNKIVSAILSYPPDTMSKAEFMADQILAALSHELIEALELRDARFEEILEWVREETEVGTAYECECGHSTYHRFNKECENCGREFPFLDLLCFKLGANVPDEDSPARQALRPTKDTTHE